MAADPDAPTHSLASPARAAGPPAGPPAPVAAGARIGRYLVRSCIDRGGMGVVYEAVDQALGRRVALKLILGDVERDPAMAARLVREARASAGLSHPNVVTVYEVGEHEGAPFLAMELVDGVTARQWLRTPRSRAEVLRVFLEAGRGLAAAHRAGIVHRDVKPDNILVGGDRARVADFGLARAVAEVQPASVPGGASDASPYLTEAGTVLGTPGYMAPEQRSAGLVDARSDQYSFCVALVEALTGRRPRADGAPATAGLPARLARILARGLQRDPAARWPTMAALLAALEAQRQARRRWLTAGAGAVLVAGASALLLLRAPAPPPCRGAAAGLDGIWDAPARARLAAAVQALGVSYAPDTWRAVERTLDRYAADWVDMHQRACQATRVQGEQSEDLLDRRMACLDRRRRGLAVLTRSLVEAGAAGLASAPGDAEGLAPIADCADVGRLAADSKASESPVAEQMTMAMIQLRAGRLPQALAQARSAVATARSAGDRVLEAEALVIQGRVELDSDLAAAPGSLAAAAEVAGAAGATSVGIEAWCFLTQAYATTGRPAEARRVNDLAFAAWRRAPEPGLEARLYMSRGILLGVSGKYEDAVRDLERWLSLDTQALGPDAQAPRAAHRNLAIAYRRLGRFDDALAHARRSLAMALRLGEEHPDVAKARVDAGVVLSAMGRHEEALAEYRRASPILRRAFGERSSAVASVEGAIATVYGRLGRWREAIEHDRAALAAQEASGDSVLAVLTTRANLASALVNCGQAEEGERVIREVLAERVRILGSSHPDVASSHLRLCGVLTYRGRADEALRECGLAMEIDRRAVGKDHNAVAVVLSQMAEAHRLRGSFAVALDLDRRAAAMFEKTMPLNHLERFEQQTSLAFDHLGLRAPARALPLAAGALAFFASRDDAMRAGVARWAVARALWDSGRDRAGATRVARAALDDLARAGTPRLVPEIERWLAAAPRARGRE